MSTYSDLFIFLEDYNNYKVEIFSVYLTFNDLSNDISHFVLGQTFIISTCLRMSTFSVFVKLLEDYNRYGAEIFRVI